jgi:hypothetical protein
MGNERVTDENKGVAGNGEGLQQLDNYKRQQADRVSRDLREMQRSLPESRDAERINNDLQEKLRSDSNLFRRGR